MQQGWGNAAAGLTSWAPQSICPAPSARGAVGNGLVGSPWRLAGTPTARAYSTGESTGRQDWDCRAVRAQGHAGNRSRLCPSPWHCTVTVPVILPDPQPWSCLSCSQMALSAYLQPHPIHLAEWALPACSKGEFGWCAAPGLLHTWGGGEGVGTSCTHYCLGCLPCLGRLLREFGRAVGGGGGPT